MLVFGPQVAKNLNKTHIVCLIILLKILFENETSEVVVTQLVEWSLSISEACGSTPVIAKFILNFCLFIIGCFEKTKINKKRPGIAHFLKMRPNVESLLRLEGIITT